MPREALQPGTDAIRTAEGSAEIYRGGWLVRARDRSGYTWRRQFASGQGAEAGDWLWAMVSEKIIGKQPGT